MIVAPMEPWFSRMPALTGEFWQLFEAKVSTEKKRPDSLSGLAGHASVQI